MKRLFYRFVGEVIPDVTRDDLIRLVVGMQWREAVYAVYADDSYKHGPEGMWLDSEFSNSADAYEGKPRPAVDIVDEWLGVR